MRPTSNVQTNRYLRHSEVPSGTPRRSDELYSFSTAGQAACAKPSAAGASGCSFTRFNWLAASSVLLQPGALDQWLGELQTDRV